MTPDTLAAALKKVAEPLVELIAREGTATVFDLCMLETQVYLLRDQVKSLRERVDELEGRQ